MNWLIIPILWGLSPLLVLPILQYKTSMRFCNISRALYYFILTSIIVFPLYIIIYQIALSGFAVKKWSWGWPPQIFHLLFYQLFYIALPEEIFFRGYLQDNVQFSCSKWGKLINICYINILFALAHIALQYNLQGIWTFFPGMVMSWLREKSDSIIAPILFHTLANLIHFSLST